MAHERQRQLVWFGLALIIALGFFLRSYHFADWLHFELDQARDARVIYTALQDGVGELPLLGPKAGGTFLRLGPAYYYLQYVSALVFGGTPAGMAAVILITSTASIVVFFFLFRRMFPNWLALFLTLAFSVSEYFVMYGRFAWNPNMLPFFLPLGMYALLRSVGGGERNPGRWFLVSIFSFGIATQLHFLAFLAVPVFVMLFLIIRRPRFRLRTWGMALAIVGALYFPMFLNELATGGANTREFFGAITEKSTKEDHVLLEKVIRNGAEHVLAGLVITTGFEGGTLPKVETAEGLLISCQGKCDIGKPYGLTMAVLLGLSVLSFCLLLFREEDRRKRDFLVATGLWFAITFTLFTPLAYGMAPRFFLLSGPFFFVLIGCLSLVVTRAFPWHQLGHMLAFGLVLVLVTLSISSLQLRFDELARANHEPVDSPPDRILKERIRVTLEQQNRIIDFLAAKSAEQHYPVYMFSEPQHRRALKYLLEQRGIENAVLGFDGIYQEGVYFFVLRAQSDLEDALRKYRENYTIGQTTSFGTLVAIELVPKPESIIGTRQDFSIQKPSDSLAPARYTWSGYFNRSSGAIVEDSGNNLDRIEDEANNQSE
ncbi:MAG: glycosyltransferase family 39 protein [Candidatus Moraniibacteriota bacterium]